MRPALPTTLRQTFIRRAPTQTRFASSNSTVETAQQKAKEALNSAQKTAEKLGEGAVKFLGPAGEKAGNLLGAYREPLLYNLAVAREFVKQVYRSEGLQPPSLNTVKEAYKTIWSRGTNPEWWRASLQNGDIARVGIHALEAYGIFKIGEIIGRRSLIGYHLQD
ncbi:putative mitochondrial ATP synthase g subunit [Lyophyllum shimeji]|uniref:Mitochondrial ATP synthase g subunit n=1 Tax=Lyophyllum shimeji TaxID=47721 RepID=A0A9P3UNG1_LYOSH|nr:putative mitochondrial ATP synthase g subunit [Lyophyllum shimeji]